MDSSAQDVPAGCNGYGLHRHSSHTATLYRRLTSIQETPPLTELQATCIMTADRLGPMVVPVSLDVAFAMRCSFPCKIARRRQTNACKPICQDYLECHLADVAETCREDGDGDKAKAFSRQLRRQVSWHQGLDFVSSQLATIRVPLFAGLRNWFNDGHTVCSIFIFCWYPS